MQGLQEGVVPLETQGTWKDALHSHLTCSWWHLSFSSLLAMERLAVQGAHFSPGLCWALWPVQQLRSVRVHSPCLLVHL